MKGQIANYTFNASTKLVTIQGLGAEPKPESVLLITNTSRGVVYYNPFDQNKTAAFGSIGYNGVTYSLPITLNASISTAGHSNDDKLHIVYDYPQPDGARLGVTSIGGRTQSGGTGIVPLNTSGALTVDGSGVTQPVSNASLTNIDADLGATSDSAATTDTGSFSLISLFKRLLGKLPNLDNGRIPVTPVTVISDTVTYNGSVYSIRVGGANLGEATDSSATTDAGTFSLISLFKRLLSRFTTLLDRIPSLSSGRMPVDGSGVTQPISASSLPLPSGAATSTNQTTANTSLSNIDTGLGAQADASASSDTGTFSLISLFKRLLSRITSLIPANLTVTSTRLLVDGSGVTQPVSGTDDYNSIQPLPLIRVDGAADSAKEMAVSSVLVDNEGKSLFNNTGGARGLPIAGRRNGSPIDIDYITAENNRLDTNVKNSVTIGSLPAISGTVTANAGTGTFEVSATSLTNIDADLGATADAAATSDTGNFSLISLVKRLLGTKLPDASSGRMPVTLAPTFGSFTNNGAASSAIDCAGYTYLVQHISGGGGGFNRPIQWSNDNANWTSGGVVFRYNTTGGSTTTGANAHWENLGDILGTSSGIFVIPVIGRYWRIGSGSAGGGSWTHYWYLHNGPFPGIAEEGIGSRSSSAASSDTDSVGLNGLFKRLLQRITTLIPANLTVSSTRLLVDGSGVTQPVSDRGATGEATVSSFTSTTSGTLKSSNSNRKLLTIYNEGAGNLHVLYGSGTASTTNYSVKLFSGDYLEVDKYTGQINAIFSSAGTARVTEIT